MAFYWAVGITYEPAAPLKKLQRKLLDVVLAEVIVPLYMIGGVREYSYGDDIALHVCAENVIKLDISTFYESVFRWEVRKLWQQFFNFPPEVAELLTDLTTYRGYLPRGAPTSSHLANLLFWREEPKLHADLARQGVRYSRYVADVSLSVRRDMDNQEVADAIARVYGMFKGMNIKANRTKQRIMRRGDSRRVHNLVVAGPKPSISKSVRDEIRVGLHNLEKTVREKGLTGDLEGRVRHLRGKIAWLKQFHPERGARAQEKLVAILEAGLPGVPD